MSIINFSGAGMHLNPIKLIRHPAKSIAEAIERPEFKKAILIVLLPTILLATFNLLSGLAIDVLGTIKYGAMSYIAWVIIASTIYFFAFLAKGKEIRGKFVSILCAVSIIWLLVAVAMAVSFLAFYSSPKIFALMTTMRRHSVNAYDAASIYAMLSSGNMEGAKAYASARGIDVDFTKYALTESEWSSFYAISSVAFIVFAVLLFYIIFVWPFLTIKIVAKLGYAPSFVWYLISTIAIVPCLLVLVLHA